MLTVILVWLGLATVLGGLGFGVIKWLLPEGRGLSVLDLVWVGWSTAVIFAQLWHLLLPVNLLAAAVVVAFAIPGAVAGVQSIKGHLRRALATYEAALIAPLVWAAAALAQEPSGNGDTGMYHLPATIWNRTFAAVPGLANLNPWLGLHSAFFTFLALLAHGPIHDTATHVCASFLVVLLLIQGIVSTGQLLRGKTGAHPWFGLMMLFAAVDGLVGRDYTSASPDLPVMLVGAIGGLALARQLDAGDDPRAATGSALFLAFIASVGLAIKPSFGFLGLALILCSIALLSRVRPPNFWPKVATAGIVFTFAAGGWALTNLLVSGYPLFPLTSFSPSLPWRLDPQAADRIRRFALAWGRMSGGPPQQLLDTWHWVWPWLVSNSYLTRQFTFPVIASGFLLGATSFCGGFKRREAVLVAPSTLALVGWFCTSPDVRFAGADLWLLLAGSSWLVLSGLRPTRAVTAVITMSVAALAVYPLASALPRMAPRSAWGLPRPPIPRLVHFVASSGLQIWVPSGGACQESIVPLCTPTPREDLALRRPGDLSHGFIGTPWVTVAHVPGAILLPNFR